MFDFMWKKSLSSLIYGDLMSIFKQIHHTLTVLSYIKVITGDAVMLAMNERSSLQQELYPICKCMEYWKSQGRIQDLWKGGVKDKKEGVHGWGVYPPPKLELFLNP